MTFDTTIPAWGIATLIISIIVFSIGAIIRMWLKQRDHTAQLTQLHNDQEEIRDLVIEKNDQTLSKITTLEGVITLQKESLIRIETLLNLLLSNRIRHDDKA